MVAQSRGGGGGVNRGIQIRRSVTNLKQNPRSDNGLG